MKKEVTAIAFPTIPVVFVASVNEKRVPLHDTMGLAVTDLEEKTKSVTSIKVQKTGSVDFLLEGKPVEERRMRDIRLVAKQFMAASGKKVGLKIESKNYNIFSGSSDSGAAALVTGLDALFETHFPKQKLADLANTISESAIRSVFGGLNMYEVSKGKPRGIQLASETELKDLRIFAMGFNYESRVSAQEIFDICKASPYWKMRVKRVPYWVQRIKKGLEQKNWAEVFSNAEENCANAHYLIESGGKRSRKKEMMLAVIAVEEMRAEGLPVYWTAGGGKVINAITWVPHHDKVFSELKKRGQKPVKYKVASGARIISVK